MFPSSCTSPQTTRPPRFDWSTNLRRRATGLSTFRGAGAPGRVQGTREMAVPRTRYLLIYEVNDDRLDIVRVMHGARAWPTEPGEDAP